MLQVLIPIQLQEMSTKFLQRKQPIGSIARIILASFLKNLSNLINSRKTNQAKHYGSRIPTQNVLFPFSLLEEKHLHCNGRGGSNTSSFGQLIVASKRNRASKKREVNRSKQPSCLKRQYKPVYIQQRYTKLVKIVNFQTSEYETPTINIFIFNQCPKIFLLGIWIN